MVPLANNNLYFDAHSIKTTNTLENLLQMGRDVPKKEEEKIYTDPFFSTCTLLLLILCVFYSRTHWERYSLEFQMYLYY